MSRNSIVLLLLVFLLVMGTMLLATRLILNSSAQESPDPITTPQSSAKLDLAPATLAGLDDLSRLFGRSGFEDIDRRRLPRGMDPAQAEELLSPALADLQSNLASTNAGGEFVLPPPITGDELFDRYALAMDEVVNSYSGESIISGIPVVVPDTVLAGWETAFGNDPRYWELRYISQLLGGLQWDDDARDMSKEEMIKLELANRHMAVGFLHESRWRGTASTNSLLLLYAEELYSGWLAQRVCAAPEPELSEDELAQLLDTCLDKEPSNAWAWYLKSFRLFGQEDFSAALAAMDAGNRQESFIHPQPFPIPQLLAGINEPSPRGGAVVTGAGLVLSRDFPITYIAMIRRDLGLTLNYIDQSGEFEVLDTWHRFSCRYALSWPEDPLLPMIGLSFISQTGEYMAQHLDDDDPRREVLREMFAARNLARRGLEDCNDDSRLKADLAVLNLVGGARGGCLAQYLQAERQARHLEQDVLPLVRDIAEVQYPDLQASADLVAYNRAD